MRALISIVVAFSFLAVAGPAVAQMKAATPMTAAMSAQNSSGETGTALFTPVTGGIKVTLTMKGAPSGTPQPAHIHNGSCAKLGSIVYPLQNVVNGKSTTTLQGVTAAKLMSGTYAVMVHKSVPQIATYVSCADLKNMKMSSM